MSPIRHEQARTTASPGKGAALVAGVAVACALGYGTLTALANQHGAPAVTIAAGASHVCELTSGGRVRCWGYNGDGELGDGTTVARLAPVGVAGLGAGVTAIAAGANHTCALMAGGALRCWGYNDFGQLGDRTAETRLAPVAAIALATPATAITAGLFHTCALTGAGWVRLGTPGVCASQSRG